MYTSLNKYEKNYTSKKKKINEVLYVHLQPKKLDRVKSYDLEKVV